MSTYFELPHPWGGRSPADLLRAAMSRRHHGHHVFHHDYHDPADPMDPPDPADPPDPPDPPDRPDGRRRHGRRGHERRERHGGFGFGPGGMPGPPPPWGGPPFGRGGPFGDPRHWPGWEGRGQRARRGDVRAAALALLAEQPMNGYQIIQEIKQRSDGRWKPSSGSVYPALQQLEDEGLIVAGEHEGRRAFSLTEQGRAYVQENQEELAAPWDTLAGGTDAEATGIAEARAAMARAAGAFMQVCTAGTDEQRRQAVRILDDARKALYRLLAEDEG